MSTSDTSLLAKASVLAGTVLAFLGFLAWWWGPTMIHWWFGHTRGTHLILFSIFVGLVIFVVGQGRLRATILGIALVIFGIGGALFQGYFVDRAYLADMEQTSEADPSYNSRAPYDVAVATSSRNMQNTLGDIQSVRFVADESENGTWNALVNRRGWLTGYESLQSSDLPLYGTPQSSDTQFCTFNTEEAGMRLGGIWPTNDLARAIYTKIPLGVSFYHQDAYGYCESSDTPLVIVPLVRTTGFLHPMNEPYGVAIYNGNTGAIDIIKDADEIAQIKGSTYSITLAARQRAALPSINGYWDRLFKRAGWESTDKDANTEYKSLNRTEIQLRRSDTGNIEYVTALTPVGNSTSIVGIGRVNAKIIEPGKRNTLTINTYPNGKTRTANTATSDAIKSQYSSLSDWANGMDVFEIAPGQSGLWEASIGKQQSIVYRAQVTAEGKITMYRADGSIVGVSQPATDTNNDGTPSTDWDVSVNLSELSDQELIELSKTILDELATRRATQ